jgi:hypothetical protein
VVKSPQETAKGRGFRLNLSPQPPEHDHEREALIQARKKELLLIAVIMTVSFCLGGALLMGVLWLILK